ncbi:MAG TPA: hypothetical protein VIM84_05265 [Gemmatimonadales bacterium]
MRRSLVTVLALLALGRTTPVLAQTCMGMASFRHAPFQMTGSGHFSQLSNSFGASLGFGLPFGPYGTVGVSSTAYDGVTGSAVGLGARAGFQLMMGKAQICPNAGYTLEMGPNEDATGVDLLSRRASFGLQVGTMLSAGPRLQVVPSVGLVYVRSRDTAENSSGASLYDISNEYGMADLGLGIVLTRQISIRPGVELPVGIEGGEPSVGVTVGYNW